MKYMIHLGYIFEIFILFHYNDISRFNVMFSSQMFPFLSFSQEVRPQRFREIQTWVVFFRSMVLSNMDSLQIPLHVSISFLEDLKYVIQLVYVEARITIIRYIWSKIRMKLKYLPIWSSMFFTAICLAIHECNVLPPVDTRPAVPLLPRGKSGL